MVCTELKQPSKDERLSWPSWLTYSGWFSDISGYPSATGRAQDREVCRRKDRRSIVIPRNQPGCVDLITELLRIRVRGQADP